MDIDSIMIYWDIKSVGNTEWLIKGSLDDKNIVASVKYQAPDNFGGEGYTYNGERLIVQNCSFEESLRYGMIEVAKELRQKWQRYMLWFYLLSYSLQ